MANAILAVASKQEESSGVAYQLGRKARQAIHMGAHSWLKGPGRSLIPDALIEKQRQEFTTTHGNEFGQP